jgi:2-hydroxy-3-keto-5-methylthiopentenyl-1-phosphate phosphatase
MPEVAAVLVDFDGTACLHDVAEHQLDRFGDPGWRWWDEAVDRREAGLREAISAQNAMLAADRDTLLGFAFDHCPMDPTFAPFVARMRERGVHVAIVSDGFGFYIPPMLAAVGLEDLPVITNEQRWSAERRPDGMAFLSGHPSCVGCGTCKMQAVLRAREEHGPVAFVGEGQTDRYGALYADVTFAKLALVDHCRRDGVPFVPWVDFDDVEAWLDDGEPLPGPVAPARCPGWNEPS